MDSPALSAPVQRPNPWPWIALSVAILAGATVSTVLALRDTDPSSPAGDYRAPVERAIAPIASANDALSDDLGGLSTGDSPEAALASATVALRDARAARRDLGDLRLPPVATRLQADAWDALGREISYLIAVRTALGEHSSATVKGKASSARSAWRRVEREIPGAGGRIAGVDTLLAWVNSPTEIADGDAGPGTSSSSADLPAAPSVHLCGNATGVNDVVGDGIGCSEALDIAARAPVAKNAAAVNGYLCSTGGADTRGVAWTCDGPAGERVTFYAVDP